MKDHMGNLSKPHSSPGLVDFSRIIGIIYTHLVVFMTGNTPLHFGHSQTSQNIFSYCMRVKGLRWPQSGQVHSAKGLLGSILIPPFLSGLISCSQERDILCYRVPSI